MLNFGENLKRIRTEKGITQEELSYRSDLAHSQIARLETGRLNTSISTVVVLAETLEVHPGDFFKNYEKL